MKKLMILIPLALLAGCAAPGGSQAGRTPELATAGSLPPRYEYQLQSEPGEEPTWFLHLVELPASTQ